MDFEFGDLAKYSLVRFLFGFGVEVEKSSIFRESVKSVYWGEREMKTSREQRRKS